MRHVIHRHGLDEATALHVEAALIDAFPSLVNKVGGHDSGDCGSMHAYDVLTKYQAPLVDLKHKIIMIKINNSMSDKPYDSDDVYDAVRFAWKIDIKKAKEAEYVLALNRGIIKGVYKVSEWLPATKENFPGLYTGDSDDRYGFIGKEAEEPIWDMYVNKRIPEEYKGERGAANPIRYTYK